MTPEQQAAYVMAQAACAMATTAGMQAENAHRAAGGLAPIYGKEDFDAVPNQYGIHHNAVIGLFHGG